MELLWARLLLVASLVITFTSQKSIFEESTDDQDDHSYRADSDQFPVKDENSEPKCICNWRHLIHYEAKGCVVVENDSCGCPTRYDCPDINEIEEDNTACSYKGKKYPSGSRINTTNPCERCRCSRGPVAEMLCYPVECPEFQNQLPSNCHYVYENNKCCPKTTVCIEELNHAQLAEEENKSTTCEYNGRIYPLGSRIYSDEDPCEICPCTEDWNNRNGTDCYLVDCALEKKKEKLLEGCVPIYHQDTCCPVDFYCATDDKFLAEIAVDIDHNSFTDSGCMFGGKFYNLGDTSSRMTADQCVTCSCLVPPDLTCVQQKCPENPNEELCTAYHTPENCCPQYDCAYGDEAPLTNNNTFERLIERVNRELEDDGTDSRPSDSEGTCFETQCNEEMTCLLYQVRCRNSPCSPVPTCLNTNSSCPVSTCASGCVVVEQSQDKCVTCACGKEIENYAGNLKCEMPECSGQNCHFIGGTDGCPTCSCIDRCPELQCDPGCNVVVESESDCPKCVCEDETEGCPTPVCEHSGCRIVNLSNGCPTCLCDRARSIPISGGESEGNSPLERWPIPQQQQQQQQQSDDVNEDHSENFQPPSYEEYGDDALLMSGSSIRQDGAKADLKERSISENSDDFIQPGYGWRIVGDNGDWNPGFIENKNVNSNEEYAPESKVIR